MATKEFTAEPGVEKVKQGILDKKRNKTPKISRPYKVKNFTFNGDTKTTDWMDKLNTFVNTLLISKYLRIKIKKDLRKNFYKFIRHTTEQKNLQYNDYLLNRTKKLSRYLSTDMCQTLTEDTKRKTKLYDVEGSGLPGKFCISGEKSFIGNKFEVFVRNVPTTFPMYSFNLTITITE